MPIIDTHAHLDHVPDYINALARAHEAGVTDIIAVSTDLAAIRKNLDLKINCRAPRVHVAFGIHPGEIKSDELDATFDFIRENIRQAVAIGETGLDYWYKWVRKDDDEKKKQRDSFQKHLDLACEFQLPIVIHSRGAWADCLTMTQSAGVKRALFHWYSGPIDILEKILSQGFYVSCSPSVGYSPQSREAMDHAPIERTLIETDSPVFFHAVRPVSDGTPLGFRPAGGGQEIDLPAGLHNQPDQGFQAEPKDVWRTLKAYAELKNIPQEEALKRLNANAQAFFKI